MIKKISQRVHGNSNTSQYRSRCIHSITSKGRNTDQSNSSYIEENKKIFKLIKNKNNYCQFIKNIKKYYKLKPSVGEDSLFTKDYTYNYNENVILRDNTDNKFFQIDPNILHYFDGDNNLHEVMVGHVPRRLIFDIDIDNNVVDVVNKNSDVDVVDVVDSDVDKNSDVINKNTNKTNNDSTEITLDRATEICDGIQTAVYSYFADEGMEESYSHPEIFSRHRNGKYSYHIIYENIYCVNVAHMKRVYDDIMEYVKVINLEKYLDVSIAAPNKSISIVGYTNKNHIMKHIYDKAFDPKDYLVTWFNYRECRKAPHASEYENVIEYKTFTDKQIIDNDEINNLLSLVEENIPDYSNHSFRNIVGGIMNFDRMSASYCDICKREHTNDNTFRVLIGDDALFKFCQKASKKYIKICDFNNAINTNDKNNTANNKITNDKNDKKKEKKKVNNYNKEKILKYINDKKSSSHTLITKANHHIKYSAKYVRDIKGLSNSMQTAHTYEHIIKYIIRALKIHIVPKTFNKIIKKLFTLISDGDDKIPIKALVSRAEELYTIYINKWYETNNSNYDDVSKAFNYGDDDERINISNYIKSTHNIITDDEWVIGCSKKTTINSNIKLYHPLRKTIDKILNFIKDSIVPCIPLSAPEKQVLGIAAPKGAGKTYAILKYIDSLPDEAKIGFISFRRSLTRALVKRANGCIKSNSELTTKDFQDYQSVRGMITHNKWVCQLESICRVPAKYRDLIVIDEVNQVIAQLFSSTIRNLPSVFARFQKILRNASQVIVMDADINDTTLDNLRHLIGDTFISINQNTYRKKYKSFITTDQSLIHNDIVEKLQNGKKICIASNKSQLYTKSLAVVLSQMGKRVLLLCRDTLNGVEKKITYNNPINNSNITKDTNKAKWKKKRTKILNIPKIPERQDNVYEEKITVNNTTNNIYNDKIDDVNNITDTTDKTDNNNVNNTTDTTDTTNNILTQDNRKSLEDVNSSWVNYDCVIYSPSVQSGVSFEKTHFDYVYGIFCNLTNKSNDCSQMLHRVRNVKCDRRVCITKMYTQPLPTTPEKMEKYLTKCMKYIMSNHNGDIVEKNIMIPSIMPVIENDNGGYTFPYKDAFFNIWMNHMCEVNIDRQEFIKQYIMSESRQGCDFVYWEDTNNDVDVDNKIVEEDNMNEEEDPINTLTQLMDETSQTSTLENSLDKSSSNSTSNSTSKIKKKLSEARKKVRTCEAEILASNDTQSTRHLEKFNLDSQKFNATMKKKSKKTIINWYEKYSPDKVYNVYKNLCEYENLSKIYNKSYDILTTSLDDDSSESMATDYTKSPILTHGLAIDLIKICGFNGLYDDNKITLNDEVIDEIKKYIKKHWLIITTTYTRMKPIKNDEDKTYIIRRVSIILSKVYGIKLKANKKTHKYQLNHEYYSKLFNHETHKINKLDYSYPVIQKIKDDNYNDNLFEEFLTIVN